MADIRHVEIRPCFPRGHFKEVRNAKNKFYREHHVEVVGVDKIEKRFLHKIVDEWRDVAKKKEDVYDLKYHKAIDNDFKVFNSPGSCRRQAGGV